MEENERRKTSNYRAKLEIKNWKEDQTRRNETYESRNLMEKE